MVKKVTFVLAALTILALLFCVIAFSNPQQGYAHMAQQNSNSTNQSLTRPGRPAITPKQVMNKATSSVDYKAFTEADAIQFAKSYKMVRETGTNSRHAVNAKFMTSKAAGVLLDTPIGVGDNDLVCVVELKGKTTISAPGSQDTGDFQNAYLVFDAQSGNLLVEGLR